jgi:Right handed beta helix region
MNRQLDVAARAIAIALTAVLADGSTATFTPSNVSTSGVYYFNSATGNDANDCRSAANACKTIAKAMLHTYAPGEKLLFVGSFAGNLTMTPKTVPSLGDPAKPIIIGSMDPANRATITAKVGGETGIVQISGVSGVTVTDLILRGPATATAGTMPRGGVMVQNPSSRQIRGLIIRNSDIGGIARYEASRNRSDPNIQGDFGANIFIAGSPGTGGISDVLIENNDVHGLNGVTSYDDTGIAGFGGQPITNITVRGNRVYDIGGGPPGLPPGRAYPPMGDGIQANGWSNVLIEHNVVHDVGANMKNCGGPAGILTINVDGALIQFNEVYNVQPAPRYDNGCDWIGIDLDNNTINSVVQYNYTHDNFNSGLYIFDVSGTANNLTLRYNISENDSWGGYLGFGAIAISVSGAPNVYIYGNTTFNNRTYSGPLYQNANQGAAAFSIAGNGNFGGLIANNLFIVGPMNDGACGGFMARVYQPGWNPPVNIKNNHFHCVGGWRWEGFWRNDFLSGQDFSSIAAASSKFQSTTTGDPMITAGGIGPNGYVLKRGSPIIGAGTDYRPLVPSPPTADYFGNSISAGAPNIGADAAAHR